MKRLLTFLTLLTVFIGVGFAEDYSWTLGYKDFVNTSGSSTDGGTVTKNNVSWTYSACPYVATENGTNGKGVQFGSSGKPVRTFSLSTSGISGTITSVKVNASTASSATATLSVSVGGTSYGTKNLTTSATDYTFTGSKSGEIIITLNQPSTSKALYLKSIEVTYTPASTGPIAPEGTIIFDPTSGSVYSGTPIHMSLNGGTCDGIKYTTNGDTPDATHGTVYDPSNPPTITEATTIKAAAYNTSNNEYAFGSVATAEYTISSGGTVTTATYIFNTEAGLNALNIEVPEISGSTYLGDNTYTVGQVTLSSTDGGTGTRIYNSNGNLSLRTYKNGGSITLSVPEGCNIIGIEMTGSSLGSLSASGGSYNSTTGTWNGNATSVTFTASNSVTIFTITVTYITSQTTTTEEYYLVGDFGGQSWPLLDEYKFTAQGDGIYVLNKVLPDMDGTENFRFKIAKVVNGQRVSPDFGGEGGEDYGLHSGWHTNIGIGNDNNHQQAFSLPDCFQANFTLNANDMTFSVDKPQLYMIGTFNNYATPNSSANGAIEMTRDTQNGGWTLTHEFTNGTEFRLYDAWHQHHGGNGAWILEELLGTWLNINNDDNRLSIFHFVLDGEYIINVKNDMSQLVATIVPESHNITCTAISDVEDGQGGYKPGGTVKAKVDGTEVTSAMAGSTVTLDIAASTGYTFRSVTLNGTAIEPVEGVYSFTMPNSDAAVVANFTVNHYNITLSNDDTQGSVSGLPETAYTGQTVSFSVTPEEGYTVKSVTVTPGSVAVTENEGTYSFGMPPFDVTVAVTYKAPLQPCTIRFEETWNETDGIGGNDGTWSGIQQTDPIVNDNEGWIYMRDGEYVDGFNGYGADACIRIGDGNHTGSATTPEIIVTNGTIYKMTFKAGSWDSNVEALLSATGAELYSDESCETAVSSIALPYRSWGAEGEQEHVVYVKATSSLMTITWSTTAAKKRYFLDEVVIDFFETPLPTELTLAQIITLGENADGKLYKISNEDGLLGVYSQGQSVWFKDEYPEQAVDYQDPLENTNYKYYTVVEDALEINKSEKDFDQSNWIEVVFQDNASYNNKYVKNLTGTYSWQNGNPKLTLTVDVDETNDVRDVPVGALAYDLNPYMAANFAGTQDGTIQGETHTYFFSKPKAQEYAQILWAVWDGSKFNMPTTNNAYGFTGSFTVSDELNGGVSLDGLQQGETYNFKAVIRKTASKAGSYEVYPTDLNPGVVTGVGMINVNGNVKSVKYVNVAGIVSDVPFQGVNIVVTEYTDGSRTTTKMLKK